MKFTLNWLKDHLETDADLDTISKTLTAIGLEVEGIEDPSEKLADFVIGEITQAEKHPDADRLKVCKVDNGTQTVQVVCGAPNAKTGLKGVFAPPGSYIPGIDLALKKGNIRGVDSEGMLLSEREIGLSDEHEGIIELPANAKVGQPYAEYSGMNDPVIEIGLTPNRADCACVRGIARDLAAAGLGTLKPLNTKDVPSKFETPVKVALQFNKDDDKTACPIFLGRAIKGVKNGPSPDWLQQRLKAVGLRPISALVDITNYLTLDLNRPLHVFDMKRLRGDIHVRFAKQGESLDALNDKSYDLQPGMTAICDDSGVIGLGGVIGGVSTSVESDTTDVYLEVAFFDPMRTARTGRDLQINSDARYRFERGIDPEFIFEGAEIATQMILDLCGGEAGDIVQAGEIPESPAPIAYNAERCEKVTGVHIDPQKQVETLQNLGFKVETKGRTDMAVTAPSWRPDIFGPADLIEEIVRIEGYDSIPVTPVVKQEALPNISSETRTTRLARQCRTVLAARGFKETVTWSFMPSERAEMFGANDNALKDQLRLKNPISSDLDQMRPTPLGNLVEAAARNNAKGFPNVLLFEVGPGFKDSTPDGQYLVAAALRAGKDGPRHWSSAESNRPVDAFDARADLMAALNACGFDAEKAPVTRDVPEYYHPGQSGTLRLGKNVLGHFGMIHPAVLSDLDVDFPVAAFELYPENIPEPKKKGPGRARLEVSDLQPVKRDFAFIVNRDVDADQIIRAAMGADKKLVQDVRVFDVYMGKGIEDSEKSIAIEVTLQPYDQTLTDADLEGISNKVVEKVIDKTGGKLRA